MNETTLNEQLLNLARKPMNGEPGAFQAYITNLGKYNEGELVGEWHPFPTTKEAIQKTFKKIGIDGIRYEEFFITDYDVEISGLYDKLPEYANLDELNYLAEKLSDMPKYNIEKLEAILESGEYCSGVQEIINLTDNLDCFDFLPDINDDEVLGYYWIEESGCYDLSSMGNLANYIDYERFGRDIRLDEAGSFVSGGYIRNNGDSFSAEYDGINVPEEYRVFAFPKRQLEKLPAETPPNIKKKYEPER